MPTAIARLSVMLAAQDVADVFVAAAIHGPDALVTLIGAAFALVFRRACYHGLFLSGAAQWEPLLIDPTGGFGLTPGSRSWYRPPFGQVDGVDCGPPPVRALLGRVAPASAALTPSP